MLFLLACQALAFEWTLVRQDGRDYVPIEDVAKFYSFTQANYSDDTINLEGATLRMVGGVNSRELYLNGLKFILSFPIIKVDNQILMSRMDLSKLVEPVLRPARIPAQARSHGGSRCGSWRLRSGCAKPFRERERFCARCGPACARLVAESGI